MNQFEETEFLVFHGDVNSLAAHVYVQGPCAPDPALQLRGHVHGPHSRLTRTLPATVPLTDLGAEPSMLARALVPDPCCWEPGQPYLYDVEVELYRGNQCVHAFRQTLGLRRFGLDRCRLMFQGQPWAVVGCYDTSVTAAPWDAWRASQVARVVVDPAERICEEASDEGVLLIAELSNPAPAALAREVHRLGKWAAVMLVIVPPGGKASLLVRAQAPNGLLAEHDVGPDPTALSEGTHLAICDVTESAAPPHLAAAGTMPWIARRRLPTAVPLEEAAAHCRRWIASSSPHATCIGCVV